MTIIKNAASTDYDNLPIQVVSKIGKNGMKKKLSLPAKGQRSELVFASGYNTKILN